MKGEKQEGGLSGQQAVNASDIQYLNTNKEIVSIACGELDPTRRPDVDLLFVGSNTNLLVYDCVKNTDVFDREINDGLSTIAMCEPGCCQSDVMEPLVIVGGN